MLDGVAVVKSGRMQDLIGGFGTGSKTGFAPVQEI